MAKKANQDLWVAWTRDAISRYSAPDDIEDPEGLVEDMVDVSTMYADAMMAEFEARFEGGEGRVRGKKSRRVAPDPDDDDDNDD